MVRTILTYDEVGLLLYHFFLGGGGNCPESIRLQTPSCFSKLSWHVEIYHHVQSWRIGGHRMAETVGLTEIGEHVALMLFQWATKTLITLRW